MDHRIQKHAEILMDYSLAIQPGETLLIQGEYVTYPLMKACYHAAILRGAHPAIQIVHPELQEILFKYGTDDQIGFIHDYKWKLSETIDVALSLMGSENPRIFTHVNPERQKRATQAQSELMNTLFNRLARGEMRWCGTLFPTRGNAQEASMSLADYEDFVYQACYLDADDPVSIWREIHAKQEKICQFLDTKKQIHFVSADTDLRLSVEGRKWINCSGKMNFPDGEVFTGPVEDSVEGHIRFSFPGIFNGQEVEDIRLTFEKGKVVEATAAKGEALLQQLLETDAGARYVGEIAVGTNYNIQRFSKNMLFDEKIGGTIHLALGRSIPESLGKNISAIHWDMLCNMRDGGVIYADGDVIYENGEFVIFK
ncbi:MAG: aminopeptidase [Gemmatimonadetes bacterium]|nr:MAG: aminopeptidase [Gemmatimonadota bacterium]